MHIYKIKCFDLTNKCMIECTCSADTMSEAIRGIDETAYDILEVRHLTERKSD